MTEGAAIPPVVARRAPEPKRRCARHDEREAVGRCMVCAGGFCRECVTEHEDRLYCGTCFAAHIEQGRRASRRGRTDWGRWKAAATTAGSLLFLVLGYYALGRMLAAIPADVHDGTVWEAPFKP